MEVLQGQMSAFDFVEDVEREEVPKENKISSKKKAAKNLEEVKNIEGQASIFDLVQEHKEEVKIDFTIEQLKNIEKLKTKKWIEYSLYSNGRVLFITIENRLEVIPQGDESKSYYINDKYRTYCINENGEKEWVGIGITRWKNPIETIIREEEEWIRHYLIKQKKHYINTLNIKRKYIVLGRE